MRPLSNLEYRKLLFSLKMQYQLEPEVGASLFPQDSLLTKISRATKRMKGVYTTDETLLFAFRPLDGWFTPSLKGAELLLQGLTKNQTQVIAHSEAEPFIRDGKSLFAQHVINADPSIMPKQEVLVTNEQHDLIGVGVAVLPGAMMLELNNGVAVKVRHGNKNKSPS